MVWGCEGGGGPGTGAPGSLEVGAGSLDCSVLEPWSFRRDPGGAPPGCDGRGPLPLPRGDRAADRHFPAALVSLPPGGSTPALRTPPASKRRR